MGFPPGNWRHQRRNVFWGVVLVALGVYFLLDNLNLLPPLNWNVVWPVLVILLGLWIIFNRRS